MEQTALAGDVDATSLSACNSPLSRDSKATRLLIFSRQSRTMAIMEAGDEATGPTCGGMTNEWPKGKPTNVRPELEALKQARSNKKKADAQQSEDADEKATGHTYVILYPSVGVVKIGQAVYYAERVEQVRNMSPVPTEVVCAFVGLHHEGDLHRRFAHLRTRGEFFTYTPELEAYLSGRDDAITHEDAVATCRYTRSRSPEPKAKRQTEGPHCQ